VRLPRSELRADHTGAVALDSRCRNTPSREIPGTRGELLTRRWPPRVRDLHRLRQLVRSSAIVHRCRPARLVRVEPSCSVMEVSVQGRSAGRANLERALRPWDPLVDGTVVRPHGVVLLEAGGVLWVAFHPSGRSGRRWVTQVDRYWRRPRSGWILHRPQAASPMLRECTGERCERQEQDLSSIIPRYFQQSPGQRSFTRALTP